jgi:hypothetical protein
MAEKQIAFNRKHPWEQIIAFLRQCPEKDAFTAASAEFGLDRTG